MPNSAAPFDAKELQTSQKNFRFSLDKTLSRVVQYTYVVNTTEGRMQMARYVCTITVNDKVIDYLESTSEQDKMDIGVGALWGSGYLDFWAKCKRHASKVREAREKAKNIVRAVKRYHMLAKYIDTEELARFAEEFEVKASIIDLDYDEEREL